MGWIIWLIGFELVLGIWFEQYHGENYKPTVGEQAVMFIACLAIWPILLGHFMQKNFGSYGDKEEG